MRIGYGYLGFGQAGGPVTRLLPNDRIQLPPDLEARPKLVAPAAILADVERLLQMPDTKLGAPIPPQAVEHFEAAAQAFVRAEGPDAWLPWLRAREAESEILFGVQEPLRAWTIQMARSLRTGFVFEDASAAGAIPILRTYLASGAKLGHAPEASPDFLTALDQLHQLAWTVRQVSILRGQTLGSRLLRAPGALAWQFADTVTGVPKLVLSYWRFGGLGGWQEGLHRELLPPDVRPLLYALGANVTLLNHELLTAGVKASVPLAMPVAMTAVVLVGLGVGAYLWTRRQGPWRRRRQAAASASSLVLPMNGSLTG